MTYFEEKARREQEAQEKQARRQAAARELRLRELEAKIAEAEAAWEEFTPEKCKGNTSMQSQKKRIEKILDGFYAERERLRQE